MGIPCCCRLSQRLGSTLQVNLKFAGEPSDQEDSISWSRGIAIQFPFSLLGFIDHQTNYSGTAANHRKFIDGGVAALSLSDVLA